MSKDSKISADGLKCILVGIPAMEVFQATAAVKYAIDLASAHGASLSLYVLPSPLPQPFPLTAGTASTWVEQEVDRLERLSSATLHGASELISRANVDLVAEQAHSPFERRDARFVQLARVHDLTVLDAADAADELARNAIEDALFDSGRPVIVVPPSGVFSASGRMAIAWDGSARAARAVKDALGLLTTAKSVVAVTVTNEKDLSRMAPGADLSTYLARHDITCRLATLAEGKGDVGARIRSFAADEDVDMIVMGAFVHSRFREAILGGATRSLLDNCSVPILMTH